MVRWSDQLTSGFICSGEQRFSQTCNLQPFPGKPLQTIHLRGCRFVFNLQPTCNLCFGLGWLGDGIVKKGEVSASARARRRRYRNHWPPIIGGGTGLVRWLIKRGVQCG